MAENSKKITGEIKIGVEQFLEIKKIKAISSYRDKIEGSFSENLTHMLGFLLGGAIVLNVSDIHLEPKEETAKIRGRIDGMLQEVASLDPSFYDRVVSRIKLLSGLKLNIRDRPQDGRFTIGIPENTEAAITKFFEVEVRVSTLPSEHGETIVMRLLNPKNLIDLESLGLRKDLFELFQKEIKKPHGMIVVTGPTGSGKTTTLYAFLKSIQSPESKIITIEDPIEYHLDGISQTQVEPKKGYDFANGLRALMRQDPDVVLVGEIRDLETASIALQAALTGHLVFSTLHTNDAAGTIPRLQALGEKPVNIAPAINMAIAQRLVRRVCKECVKKEKVTPEELAKIKKALEKIPAEIEHPNVNSETTIPRPAGCKMCNSTGYRGRIGIYEALVVTPEIEKFILTSPSIVAIREKALKNGMIPIYQDGILKVLNGITTMEEVERVTGE